MTLKSLLPFVWSEEALTAIDQAIRDVMTGTSAGADDYLLYLNGKALRLGERHLSFRTPLDGVKGLAEWPALQDSDLITGRYLGPIEFMAYWAEEQGNLLWTNEVLEVMGEDYCRRALGLRIVAGEVTGSYANVMKQLAGRAEAINVIGELANSSMSYLEGRFDKTTPPAVADEPATWGFEEAPIPYTWKPTGLDVLISTTGRVFTGDEITYLTTVIKRYVPYTLVDVRISTVSISEASLHPWMAYFHESHQTIGLT
ncbi:MAG: hypothetical protein OXC69_03260 [Candidatus Tectomicrobia bacterium]|nr:hypothetical protein [Candidatus Tectomicrobia bacterium]